MERNLKRWWLAGAVAAGLLCGCVQDGGPGSDGAVQYCGDYKTPFSFVERHHLNGLTTGTTAE